MKVELHEIKNINISDADMAVLVRLMGDVFKVVGIDKLDLGFTMLFIRMFGSLAEHYKLRIEDVLSFCASFNNGLQCIAAEQMGINAETTKKIMELNLEHFAKFIAILSEDKSRRTLQ